MHYEIHLKTTSKHSCIISHATTVFLGTLPHQKKKKIGDKSKISRKTLFMFLKTRKNKCIILPRDNVPKIIPMKMDRITLGLSTNLLKTILIYISCFEFIRLAHILIIIGREKHTFIITEHRDPPSCCICWIIWSLAGTHFLKTVFFPLDHISGRYVKGWQQWRV